MSWWLSTTFALMADKYYGERRPDDPLVKDYWLARHALRTRDSLDIGQGMELRRKGDTIYLYWGRTIVIVYRPEGARLTHSTSLSYVFVRLSSLFLWVDIRLLNDGWFIFDPFGRARSHKFSKSRHASLRMLWRGCPVCLPGAPDGGFPMEWGHWSSRKALARQRALEKAESAAALLARAGCSERGPQ